MSEATKEQVEEAIKGYVQPHLNRDLVSAKSIKGIDIEGRKVKVVVELGFPAKGVHQVITAAVKELAESVDGVDSADVSVTSKVAAHAVQKALKPIDNVKNNIAVASGKGRRGQIHHGGQPGAGPCNAKGPGSVCWTQISTARAFRRC